MAKDTGNWDHVNLSDSIPVFFYTVHFSYIKV